MSRPLAIGAASRSDRHARLPDPRRWSHMEKETLNMTLTTHDPLADALHNLQRQLHAAGAPAPVGFSAETRLVDGFQTTARVRQFSFTVDEPPSLGGTDTGPNPVELVLAALGTCQEIVFATYARFLNVPIESLAIRVSGDLDLRGFLDAAEVPAGYRAIDFDVAIESPASLDEVARLVEAVNRHCPVLDILQRGLPVDGHYALNGTRLEAAS
jgi:putative redox protein